MADDAHSHLRFERTQHENPRRPRGGPRTDPPQDPAGHGRRIREEVEQVQASPAQEPGFDPRLLLKLEVENPDPRLFDPIPGITLVGQEGRTLLVLFADNSGLAEFKRRLAQLEAGEKPTRKEILYAVKSVSHWGRDDRLGQALRAQGVPTATSVVDVELWPLELTPQRRLMLDTFRGWCGSVGAQVLDVLNRRSVIVARVSCEPDVLERILHHRDVREVDLPPVYGFDFNLLHVPVTEISGPDAPAGGAPVVGVLDTGVVQSHPLLAPALGDAQSFTPGASAEDEAGHGTHVAGLALYGDVQQAAKDDAFVAHFRILSGRVSDPGDGIQSAFLENRVAAAVKYFVENYDCRLFNLSFADELRVYQGGHVNHLAALLDELALEYAVLFVVPTGNFRGGDPAPRWRQGYPDYLFREDARVLDPAPAVNVLTVGSLARNELPRMAQRHAKDPGYVPVARRDQPSPFTRTGPGAGGAIKPDVVEYGGNWSADVRGGDALDRNSLGELSLNRNFAGGNLFVLDGGTSQAAPKVTNLAAHILRTNPEASPDLIRSLIAAHARIPTASYEILGGESDKLRFCVGYGLPRREASVASSEDCVTLWAEDSLEDDQYHYYELPIPDDFLKQPARRDRWITVAVAHMPPVRRTRFDYRANRLDFRIVRATDIDKIESIYRKGADAKPIKEPGGVTPGPSLRDAGTLQCAHWHIKQLDKSWRERRPFVVVSSRPPVWGRAEGRQQRYSLVVVIEDSASADVKLYTQIELQLRARARVRV